MYEAGETVATSTDECLMADPITNPYDEAVQRITNTIAGSRFTKTPINIKNNQKIWQPLVDALKTMGGSTQSPISTQPSVSPIAESEGEYSKGNGISVELPPNPTYKDFANTLHHEDIHALLDKTGNSPPDMNGGKFINQIKSLFLINSLANTDKNFANSNRVGNRDAELPAYMGSFQQGQIPGVTQDDSNKYIQLMHYILPSQVSQNYQRIVDSVRASQR